MQCNSGTRCARASHRPARDDVSRARVLVQLHLAVARTHITPHRATQTRKASRASRSVQTTGFAVRLPLRTAPHPLRTDHRLCRPPLHARSVPNGAALLRRWRRSRRSSCAWCVTPCFPGWRRAPLGRQGGDAPGSGVATLRGCAGGRAARPSTAARAALTPPTPDARRGASVAGLGCALCGTLLGSCFVSRGASARRSARAGDALRTGGASLAGRASPLLRRASDARRRGGARGTWARRGS